MKRHILFAAVVLSIAVSCTDRGIIRALDDIESCLSEHPDSALSVLDSLSTAGIQGREANAKFGQSDKHSRGLVQKARDC